MRTGLSSITSHYIDKPYDEMTCLHMVRDMLVDMGYGFPSREEIEEINFNSKKYSVDNHLEQYGKNPVKMQAIMLKLFFQFFDKVEYPILGDVIFVKNRDEDGLVIWPSIYIGKDLAIASFVDAGVKVFRYKLLGKPFLFMRLKRGKI